jgi:hypothetical protein
MRLVKPEPALLRTLFAEAQEGVICTPFYTRRGLSYLDEFFNRAEGVRFLTRLNIMDWKNGVADLPILIDILETLENRGVNIELLVNDKLHAKLYLADFSKCLAGSANLTEAGFGRNAEIMFLLEGEETEAAKEYYEKIVTEFIPIPLGKAREFVDVVRGVVENVRKIEGEKDLEYAADLYTAVEIAEDLISTVISQHVESPPDIESALSLVPEITEFIKFCRRLKTPDSKLINARHRGKQNLQGHVKQAYYGVALFLLINPDLRPGLEGRYKEGGFHLSAAEWSKEWALFLSNNYTLVDPEKKFSLRTLRNILPETAGGLTTTGGGGISTLNRTFPLVAEFFLMEGI